MRPDPHKQKASRRYQAKHRTAAPVSVQEAPQARSAEQNAYSEEFSDISDNAEVREEEDIDEFLKYLKDESQRVSTEQSAVYFQLRAESESVALGAHNEGMWQRLLDVDWDSSLKSVVTGTTLQELLDADYEFAPTDEVRESDDVALEIKPATQSSAQMCNITRQLNTVELAPNAKSLTLGQPVAPLHMTTNRRGSAIIKGSQPTDDLEAFLDDLL